MLIAGLRLPYYHNGGKQADYGAARFWATPVPANREWFGTEG
jgi:hypothetical protein